MIRNRALFKILLVAAVIIGFELMAFFLIVTNYTETTKNEYEKSLSYNLDGYSTYLNRRVNEIADNIYEEYTNGDYVKKAELVISENGAEISGQLMYSTGSFEKIAEKRVEELTENKLFFINYSKLVTTNASEATQYGIITAKHEEKYYCIFFDANDFFKTSENYGYSKICIAKNDEFDAELQNVLKSSSLLGNLDGEDFTLSIVPSQLIDTHKLWENKTKEGYYISSEFMSEEGYYIVGYVTDVEIKGFIDRMTGANGFLILFITVMSVGLALIAITVYIKEKDFLNNFGYEHKGAYVLLVNERGDILKYNKDFHEKYSLKNLFEYKNIDYSFIRLSNNDNIVLKIPDKNKNEELVSFLVVKLGAKYKLVGTPAANVEEYYRVDMGFSNKEPTTGMFNETRLKYDFTIKKERQLLGLFELVNLNVYGLMFGRAFFSKVVVLYSKKIKELFGDIARVYCLGANGLFAAYTDNDKDTAILLRDISAQMNKLNVAVQIGDNVVKINCKSGFVIIDGQLKADSYEEIMRTARATLLRAKKEKDKDLFIFQEMQRLHYKKYFDKDYDVAKLIAEDKLELFYQPQVSLKTERIEGVEALLRVKGSTQADLNIQELVEFAERSGQMIMLGNFVIEKGMEFAKSIMGKNVDVSLNVSSIQIMQSGFAEMFLSKFREFGLKRGSISIEITESVLVGDSDLVLSRLKLLHDNGINIHLDDFGVAYSSMLYLKNMPIASIKMDKEFIVDISSNVYSQAIAKMVINLCKELKLKSIAEGVEFDNQLKVMKEYGCDLIQGYYYSKPVNKETITKMIEKGTTAL